MLSIHAKRELQRESPYAFFGALYAATFFVGGPFVALVVLVVVGTTGAMVSARPGPLSVVLFVTGFGLVIGVIYATVNPRCSACQTIPLGEELAWYTLALGLASLVGLTLSRVTRHQRG